MTEDRSLAGYRVGITSSRRIDELASLLERRGATVESAPALTILSCAEDVQLRTATLQCIDSPPDLLIANTGVGMRGWFNAAREWQLGDQLVEALRRTEILARGPKAVGAVRAAGLRESWATDTEALAEILAHLRLRDLAGLRVVLQEHGTSTASVAAALHRQGAEVTVLTVYKCFPAADHAPLFRLVDLVADRELDAVTFTAAPAAKVVVDVAQATGRKADFLEALRTHVIATCIGPVTAEVFDQLGVPTVQPARSRLAAMVRELAVELPRRRQGTRLQVAGHQLVLAGDDVLVDGAQVRLTPAPYAVLRLLSQHPGKVVSRRDLLATLPSGLEGKEHAVEAAVARLRAAIGAPLVKTVVKRGYLLPAELGTVASEPA
ncbi:MAG TPA: uroporphyrinogen-III synthase [Dermatophilaceae bacterium]|nr:uroporphyrinogen-III synthase [Dermatophilaceae bacterium]